MNRRKATLATALGYWCSRLEYLANVADMGHRYGLDGIPVAELTEVKHANARQAITAIRAAKIQRLCEARTRKGLPHERYPRGPTAPARVRV
jgi:sRNA-binding protein